jgi:hypothetical protein
VRAGAPSIKRYQKEFQPVWDSVRQAIQQADEIISIGFAFNDNDTHVCEEMKNTVQNSVLNVKIINPDADSLQKTYREVFPNAMLTLMNMKFSEWVAKNEKN